MSDPNRKMHRRRHSTMTDDNLREHSGAVAGTERADGKFEGALERIALLDEADGHELTREHALRAVAIATSTLGKHPSEILARTNQYDPAFVEELKRADAAPPEAEFSNVEEMLEHLNGGAVAGTERGSPAPDLYKWPVGCHSPNSCSRNGRCMYVGCRHDGADITALSRPHHPPTENKGKSNG